MENNYTFRFDDVCINANITVHNNLSKYLFEKFSDCVVIWAISPLVHSNEKETQRVFPQLWNAMSDIDLHFTLDRIGLPKPEDYRIIIASHGLVHCDHRLLTKEQQQMSILLSCSVLNTKVFVPPFNKWNKDTEEICKKKDIELIKFEDGWKCMEYNGWYPPHKKWYLHGREWNIEKLNKWLQ